MRYVFALLCTVTSVQADELTIQKCLELNTALRALDTPYDYVIKDGPRETVAHRRYKLGNAWGSVALNLTALAPLVAAQEDLNRKLISEIAGESGKIMRWIDNDHIEKGETPEYRDYSKRMQVFLDRPCNIEFSRIKRSELKITDDNPIPFAIQGPLEAILE